MSLCSAGSLSMLRSIHRPVTSSPSNVQSWPKIKSIIKDSPCSSIQTTNNLKTMCTIYPKKISNITIFNPEANPQG